MCTQPPQSPSGPNLPAPPPPASAAAAPSIARASDQQPPMAPAQAATAGLPNGAAPEGTAVSPPASPQVAPTQSAQTGAAPKGKEGGDMQAPAGSVSDFETTHYGNADDPNGDKLTKAGKGAWSDLQDGRSLALNTAAATKLGVKPGDEIELSDAKGNTRVGRYDDQVPEKDPKTGAPIKGTRIDIYDPKGSEKKGVPFAATSARKLKTAAETLYPKG